MINWQYFPKSDMPPKVALNIVSAFEEADERIDSFKHELSSNSVLDEVCDSLGKYDFLVEQGKKKSEKIHVPVLFGLNGKLEKYFDADAFNKKAGFVLDVEAGRAVDNNQFLKDLFQACMMHDVKYLGVAVRNTYRNKNDFDRVIKFIDTLYSSNRLKLPLEGILILGY